jgi:ParB-like chromosome segregation protein Spo0J
VSDLRNSSGPIAAAIGRFRSEEFDASIFEKVAGQDDQDCFDQDESLEAEEPAPQREGLPAGFRMRHDAHYVEELASRNHAGRIHLISTSEIDDPRPDEDRDLQPLVASVADFGVLEPLLVRRLASGRCELIAGSRRLAAAIAAGLERVPCLEHAADDERAKALADAARRPRPRNGHQVREFDATPSTATAHAEIGQSLDAIGACLHLFRDATRPEPERVALDLIAAEVCRATWLVQALSVLNEDLPIANATVDLGSVVKRIARALTPGRHRAGATIEIDVSASDICARGDEPLLTVAIAGTVMALQAATERVGTAVVRVRVGEGADGRVSVEATQEALRMPAAWRARFLDLQWTDRPGGRRIAVALAASRRIAELHHGTLTMEDVDHGGCRLALSLPRV